MSMEARAPKPAADPPAPDSRAIEDWIRERIAHLFGTEASGVHVHKPVATFGVDSAEAAALAEDLEQWIGRTVPLDLVWEWASVREIADRVAEHLRQEDA